MKKFISLALALSLASSMQAHFFAYQEWISPDGKTIIEEYYDHHLSDESANIDSQAQQNALIKRAQRLKKSGSSVLMVVEDMFGAYDQARQSIKNPETDKNLNYIAQLKAKKIAVNNPLVLLYYKSLINNIPAINTEFRLNIGCPIFGESGARLKEIELFHALKSYNPNPDLAEFYENLEKYAREIKSQTIGVYDYVDFLIDALTLNTINENEKTHKYSRLMLAYGGTHFSSINSLLLKLGWKSNKIEVPSGIKPDQAFQLIRSLETTSTNPAREMLSMYSDWIAYKLHYKTAQVAIDINAIPLNLPLEFPQRTPNVHVDYEYDSEIAHAHTALWDQPIGPKY